MKISRILATKAAGVVTVLPEASLREAVGLLVKHRIGVVIVVDTGGDVVGILSERDVIQRLVEDDNCLANRVADVMTREVVVGMPQDDVMSVAHLMTERRFRHLPIIDEGNLVGIISIGDVLKAQRDTYRGEIDTLETQLTAEERD